MNGRRRGRPAGTGHPAYEGVIELATARMSLPDAPASATEAVREAIEALAIDLSGTTPTLFSALVPTKSEMMRNTGRRLTARNEDTRYTLASDDSLVEYLARRIVRSPKGRAKPD